MSISYDWPDVRFSIRVYPSLYY